MIWKCDVTQSSSKDHYSYRIYAETATARQFDQSHFGGPIGRLIAEEQERVLIQFLGDLQDDVALDVGTGTGRAAVFLAGHGAKVTALDASREMLKVARGHAAEMELSVDFMPGDAYALAFSNGSFDTVISLRMLMHTPNWRRCLSEMCRVARRRVLFDYPPLASASAFQVVLRRIAQLAGRRVEAYHVISTAAIRTVLQQEGFRIVGFHRQYVLPIGFHKLIGSLSFTRSTERFLASLGLTDLVGAPVTIVAERFEK